MDEYITVYKPIAGWKAVHVMWDEEMETFIPLETGYWGYSDKALAIIDAKNWARDCEIEYIEELP